MSEREVNELVVICWENEEVEERGEVSFRAN